MGYNDFRALLVKRFELPKERALRSAVRHFTLAEKAVFYFFVVIFILTGTILILRVDRAFMTSVPFRGGSLTEGVVGNPRFINPVLALSESDKDLTALIYSGLLRRTPGGQLVNDLASHVSISDDGLTYTATIRPDARFQDGSPVTADDVIFTIQEIQDPAIRSPRFADWSGITVAKVDDATLTFTLKKAYAPFMQNLTIGVLPKHIWKNVSSDEFLFSQYNSLPVGSGPYQVDSVERDSGGIPNYYSLTAFGTNASSPYITHLIFKFYSNEDAVVNAYNNGDVTDISGVSADQAVELKKNGANIISAPLPRVFGVFFNQSQAPVLLQKEVREALDAAAPKEDIVNNVLEGYGTVMNGPLPPSLFPWIEKPEATTTEGRLATAESILVSSGWKKDSDGIFQKKTKSDTLTLSFSISTSDSPELKAAAELLKAAWEKLGAHVDVQVFDAGDLNQNVIRPRHYDALLFGEVVGTDADVYPFWHSSERNDPGLNIALYANSKVDKLLDDARSTSDADKRQGDYQAFEHEVENDVPAVFLYTPSFLYVLPDSVHNAKLTNLSETEDRFLSVRDWYVETDRVWNIFATNQN